MPSKQMDRTFGRSNISGSHKACKQGRGRPSQRPVARHHGGARPFLGTQGCHMAATAHVPCSVQLHNNRSLVMLTCTLIPVLQQQGERAMCVCLASMRTARPPSWWPGQPLHCCLPPSARRGLCDFGIKFHNGRRACGGGSPGPAIHGGNHDQKLKGLVDYKRLHFKHLIDWADRNAGDMQCRRQKGQHSVTRQNAAPCCGMVPGPRRHSFGRHCPHRHYHRSL